MLKLAVGLGVVLVLFTVVAFALWPHLRHQATYPGGRLTEAEGDPARWGLPTAEQVWLETADGVRIHGWWVPARVDDTRPEHPHPGRAPARPDGSTADGPVPHDPSAERSRGAPANRSRGSPADRSAPGSPADRSAPGSPADETEHPASRACGAVIYFHGNGNTIAPRAWLARRLAGLGLDVLLFDYRGYGLSEGRPGEEGLRLDARAAYDHVVERRDTPPDRLILFGHSLGSAVATELALHRPAAALVLGAPFPGFPDLFRHHAPWLPLRLLPWRDDRYEAGSRIGQLDMPVLIALGTRDRIIPPRFSREVHDAAAEPRTLVETPADHNTLVAHPDVWNALEELVDTRLGCP